MNFHTCAFEKIHCDLWGLAPETFGNKYKYYVSFVFSHFVWLQQFCHIWETCEKGKSPAKIKIFHSDGGGEFMSKVFVEHLQELLTKCIIHIHLKRVEKLKEGIEQSLVCHSTLS